jgi:serine protease
MADLKNAGWNVAAINCSFGTSGTGGLPAAVDFLIAQDVIIVVAAGNSNSSSPDYLGSRGDCLDVGATDQNGNPASFSNYGSWVDIAAPGVSVMSTFTDPDDPSGDYVAYMDGTSMSCPHVVGVAALLESFNPSLSAADKINIITNPDNTTPYNQTKDVGVGIVDARKCLDAAQTCDLDAYFSGDQTWGCAPLTVNFTDLSTGTDIDDWLWDFGDGIGTSTAQNPSYIYNDAGTYTVSLTVSSSSQGCEDTITITGYITADGPPVVDFEGSPTSDTEPLTVDFTDLSTNATGWS